MTQTISEIWRDLDVEAIFKLDGKIYQVFEVQPWGILALSDGKLVDLDAEELSNGVIEFYGEVS